VAAGHTWLAERGAHLVGVLVLEHFDDHVLVENLAVLPDAQGMGIGSRLLRYAEDQAQARGVQEVRLYTHELMTENRAYYPRRGYRETHRSGEPPWRRVFFAKQLPRSAASPEGATPAAAGALGQAPELQPAEPGHEGRHVEPGDPGE
jgi:N-acetylglutamate synthase-like GNAT family acetyltransferase